jgi:hypothetical protein
VWLIPHAAVAREGGLAIDALEHLNETCDIGFNADGKKVFALARSLEHLLEICNVVVRLLAASVVHSVVLERDDDASIINPTLTHLMQQCQSLKVLTL